MQPKIKISDVKVELGRRSLRHFAKHLDPSLHMTGFHAVYYDILTLWAKKVIKNLIVTIPPQHGKSDGCSRYLPAYILGDYPDDKIAIGSYSGGLARGFNLEVQRKMMSAKYMEMFPKTKLGRSGGNEFRQNSTVCEVVNHKGGLLTVGRGGSLTGNPVDRGILDDLYKDVKEANSPLVRQSVLDWYLSVFQKRLHNDSQQLITFTRWHKDDLIGYLLDNYDVLEVKSMDDFNVGADWYFVNFPAIKEDDPTDLDPREYGEALWPEKHSVEKLEAERKLDRLLFECMNQGNPQTKEGLLYDEFDEYDEITAQIIGKGNVTDPADKGDNYNCSVCYDKSPDKIYITDVYYSQARLKIAEDEIPLMLERNGTRYSYVEGNSAGSYFSQNLQEKTKTKMIDYHQGGNKEARVLTNASTVNSVIVFPKGWKRKWPEFAKEVTGFKKLFSANSFDDGVDVLTSIIEKEGMSKQILYYGKYSEGYGTIDGICHVGYYHSVIPKAIGLVCYINGDTVYVHSEHEKETYPLLNEEIKDQIKTTRVFCYTDGIGSLRDSKVRFDERNCLASVRRGRASNLPPNLRYEINKKVNIVVNPNCVNLIADLKTVKASEKLEKIYTKSPEVNYNLNGQFSDALDYVLMNCFPYKV